MYAQLSFSSLSSVAIYIYVVGSMQRGGVDSSSPDSVAIYIFVVRSMQTGEELQEEQTGTL
eukprot:1160112-Pelagomonas_calceolata.AAC.11